MDAKGVVKLTLGTMQDVPLQISSILEYAVSAHSDREIISFPPFEERCAYDYAALGVRSRKAAGLLVEAGIACGDRISSLAWNTHRHLELFFGAAGMGVVLHTANPRLSDEHLIYTINHAGSRLLFYDVDFQETIDRIEPQLTGVERFVVLGSSNPSMRDGHRAERYEALIGRVQPIAEWPQFDENRGAFLCYTSGTTGDPKGVVYSHRSVVLHALAASLNGALGLTAFDCVMPCQSMYHATAWGLPFAAPINGCKLVLPGSDFSGENLQSLIKSESVTFSGGVPTIWTMYLDHLDKSGEDSGTLERLVIGGSAVPRSMSETFENRYGVTVRQIWGMTEISPLGVVGTPTARLAAKGPEAANDTLWGTQGRVQFGIDVKIEDDEARSLPWDGITAGRLKVRGPWAAERYFRSEVTALDAGGWFDTGDLAVIDQDGFLRITDRAKDVIKSGGEWISSIDLENAASAYPGVRFAAVVGIHHPKWEERPLLVLELHDGAKIADQDVRAFLAERFPRWWLPDATIFARIPLTSTGKIDKKQLRTKYKSHLVALAKGNV